MNEIKYPYKQAALCYAIGKIGNEELLIFNKYCPYGESLREIDKNNEVVFVIYSRNTNTNLVLVQYFFQIIYSYNKIQQAVFCLLA